MRRAVLVLGVVIVLVSVDAVFNQWGVSVSVYRDVMEFGRLVNRVVAQGS